MSLLNVNQLSIDYQTRSGMAPAVKQISFSLEKGSSLGLIGESGCGKTTIGMGILQLLPENAVVTSGSIEFRDRNLVELSEEALRAVRGKDIAMIFQAAMNSLNPVHRVGDQVAEAIQAHDRTLSRKNALKETRRLFKEVDIAPERMNDFPHQYSGGMKQRAVIAMALACRPDIIIADEPTTALDMLVQKQILLKLKQIQAQHNIAIILISHDMGVVSEVCHHIAVMLKGEMIEYGTRQEILFSPLHPYTIKLLASCLTLDGTMAPPDFTIKNQPFTFDDEDSACCFYRDCPRAVASCATARSKWEEITKTHRVLCQCCR